MGVEKIFNWCVLKQNTIFDDFILVTSILLTKFLNCWYNHSFWLQKVSEHLSWDKFTELIVCIPNYEFSLSFLRIIS